MKILIINGPNLNLLGTREPEIYGSMTYKNLLKKIKKDNKGINFTFFQSNIEGKIVTKIQKAKRYDGIVINAGAYTHTSIAIHDAFKAINHKYVMGVHISNINEREDFRKTNLLTDVVNKEFIGYGLEGYNMAVKEIQRQLLDNKQGE